MRESTNELVLRMYQGSLMGQMIRENHKHLIRRQKVIQEFLTSFRRLLMLFHKSISNLNHYIKFFSKAKQTKETNNIRKTETNTKNKMAILNIFMFPY